MCQVAGSCRMAATQLHPQLGPLSLAVVAAALAGFLRPAFVQGEMMCHGLVFGSDGSCGDELLGLRWERNQAVAVCSFCDSVYKALQALQSFRAWDPRTIDRLANVRRTFEWLRRVEQCSAVVGLQYCGALVDVTLVFEMWLQDDWTSKRWQQMLRRVDVSAREDATSAYAWWRIVRSWHDVHCRDEEPVLLAVHCLGKNFHEALEAAKATYNWEVAREAYETIMAFGSVISPVDWPHEHKTHQYYVPHLEPAPALWSRSDASRIGRLARLLEASAGELQDAWDDFRSLPWVRSSEEFMGYPHLLGNASESTWRRWVFYSTQRGWNDTLCSHARAVCATLQSEFPGPHEVAALPSPAFEEVAISELPPGAHVGVHSGAPWRVNLHFGLAGITHTSYLAVVRSARDVVYAAWAPGIAQPIFDDSYDHFVQIDAEAAEPRVILHVAVFHPTVADWFTAE